MEQNILNTLKAAKIRLEEWNGLLRTGSLGEAKNKAVIARINELLPKEEKSLDPKNYNPELVYPG